jgi:cytoskeleton protein RodZ
MFEIGNSLREARERQGLDHSQVELATKIRAKYIKALEDEQFELLPSGTYIKGFLRSYAEYLGLDGQLYVDEYNSRFIAERGLEEGPRERRQPRIRQERALERRIVLFALLGIAAVTALVIVAWKYGGGDSSSSTPAVVTPKPTPAPKGLQFVGRGKGTYLEIRRRSATGPVVFQGTLKAGDAEFLVGTRFWLAIRRPAGVRFRLAGKPVSLPLHRNLKVVVTPTKTDRVTG